MYYAKVLALIENEWDPENCNRDIWADSNCAENF